MPSSTGKFTQSDHLVKTYGCVHTAVFKMGDQVHSAGNSARCYVAAWMGEEPGREWIDACVWWSPSTVRLKPSQPC